MRYTRTGIIAVLIAVEIVIAGAMVASAGGLKSFSTIGDARAFGYVPPTPLASIDAGGRPHVVIDDAGSRVIVSASNDGKVHVADTKHIHGWGWGSTPSRLEVEKTSDGVLIRRPETSEPTVILGFEFGGTSVQIPPGSTLEIQAAGGADVSDLTGAVTVHSNDGHISATNVRSANLSLQTGDGHISLDGVDADQLNAVTSDGAIRVANLRVRNGVLHTSDGSIRVQLADGNDVTVRASTSDGSIRLNGIRQDGSPAEYKIGNGSGSLDVATQDGSIRVTSNGAN